MATDNTRVASSNGTDERQPLLARTEDAEPNTQERFLVPRDPNAEPLTPVSKDDDLDWRWYTFYTILTVLGLVALALLIKGFIDAGDNDVRRKYLWYNRPTLIGFDSSTSLAL